MKKVHYQTERGPLNVQKKKKRKQQARNAKLTTYYLWANEKYIVAMHARRKRKTSANRPVMSSCHHVIRNEICGVFYFFFFFKYFAFFSMHFVLCERLLAGS